MTAILDMKSKKEIIKKKKKKKKRYIEHVGISLKLKKVGFITVLRNFAIIQVLPCLNNPKYLDFWNCFGRKKNNLSYNRRNTVKCPHATVQFITIMFQIEILKQEGLKALNRSPE